MQLVVQEFNWKLGPRHSARPLPSENNMWSRQPRDAFACCDSDPYSALPLPIGSLNGATILKQHTLCVLSSTFFNAQATDGHRWHVRCRVPAPQSRYCHSSCSPPSSTCSPEPQSCRRRGGDEPLEAMVQIAVLLPEYLMRDAHGVVLGALVEVERPDGAYEPSEVLLRDAVLDVPEEGTAVLVRRSRVGGCRPHVHVGKARTQVGVRGMHSRHVGRA